MNPTADNLELLRQEDVLLCSYPRSGNTWMRQLLGDLLLQVNGVETATKLPLGLEALIPDIHMTSIRSFQGIGGIRVIKSHHGFRWSGQRVLFVFRNPADALVSFYHYHLLHETLRSRVADGLEAFCLGRVDDWRGHTGSYLEARDKGCPISFVSYEALSRDPVRQLRRAAEFVGMRPSDEQIGRAVDHHRFGKQAVPPEQREPGKEYFFRNGRVGTARDELSPEALAAIAAATDDLYLAATRFL